MCEEVGVHDAGGLLPRSVGVQSSPLVSLSLYIFREKVEKEES